VWLAFIFAFPVIYKVPWTIPKDVIDEALVLEVRFRLSILSFE